MKRTKSIFSLYIGIALLIVVLLAIYTYRLFSKNIEIEGFDIKQNIDYYVITMREESRMKNIETQIKKSGIQMNILPTIKYRQTFMQMRVKNSQINSRIEKTR